MYSEDVLGDDTRVRRKALISRPSTFSISHMHDEWKTKYLLPIHSVRFENCIWCKKRKLHDAS